MVDPISEAERATFTRRLIYGVTALVGLSAGLVAAQANATLPEAAGAVALGLVLGYPLARFIVPSGPAPATRQRRRREQAENPFADGGDPGENETGGSRETENRAASDQSGSGGADESRTRR